MKYSLKDLTLEEKMRLLCGKDHWHIYDANGKLPVMHLSDGPNGLRKIDENRKTVKTTAMPNISVLANAWNKDLAFLDGATIADDCIDENVDVLLAPGVNIKRTPYNGRNFEYFSEDPYLAGQLARKYIEGVQSKGIGVSLKHYLCNNSETDRLQINSDVDERTLREIYLPAFEEAVKAKPTTVMCSYNMINGIYAAENKKYLKDILRDKFGFDGVIVSDWEAYRSAYRSVKASLDLVMPYDEKHYEQLKAAYEKGLVTEKEIDECAGRIIDLINYCKNSEKKVSTTKEQRHENAVEIAREGIVLLKNEGILPLKKGKISVCGTYAQTPEIGGGGSAYAETEFKQENLASLLQEHLGTQAEVKYCSDFILYNNHFSRRLKAAMQDAYESDIAVVAVGRDKTYESESIDMPTTKLPFETESAIVNIAKNNPDTVVLLYAGSAVDMSNWIDLVKGVVYVGYAGEGVNQALAEILCGKTVPSGKLNESFALFEEDAIKNDYDGFTLKYDEGVFVGYRRFEKYGLPLLFPFGHGLSYASFEYSDIELTKNGDTDFTVSYTIKNTSSVDAKEISEVYVKDVHSTVARPEKELKGFSKDLIKAGESKRISVDLNRRSFAYYSVALDDWRVENGWFEILVGASSQDIRLTKKIKIELPDETQFSLI